jgi:hypothetical protein
MKKRADIIKFKNMILHNKIEYISSIDSFLAITLGIIYCNDINFKIIGNIYDTWIQFEHYEDDISGYEYVTQDAYICSIILNKTQITNEVIRKSIEYIGYDCSENVDKSNLNKGNYIINSLLESHDKEIINLYLSRFLKNEFSIPEIISKKYISYLYEFIKSDIYKNKNNIFNSMKYLLRTSIICNSHKDVIKISKFLNKYSNYYTIESYYFIGYNNKQNIKYLKLFQKYAPNHKNNVKNYYKLINI